MTTATEKIPDTIESLIAAVVELPHARHIPPFDMEEYLKQLKAVPVDNPREVM